MTRRLSECIGRSLATGAILLASLLHAAEWERLPPLPQPNGGFITGIVDGKVYVIGGTNWEGGEKHWLSQVHEFDPQSRTWTSKSPLESPLAYAVSGQAPKGLLFWDRPPLNGRPLHPPKYSDGGFGIAGGTTGSAGNQSQQWRVRPNQWLITPGLPPAETRVLASGGVMGDLLVFVGGTDDPANIAGLKRTAISLDREGVIKPLPDYPGKPFGTAASAVAGDSLFVFGGANWTGKEQEVNNTDEAYAFSMSANTWRKLEPFPYPARGLTAVFLRDGVIYIAGGYKNDQDGFTNQAFLYHIGEDRYTPAPALPYKAMVGLVECDGFIYCLGGEDKQKSRTDACFRIKIAELLK